MFADITKLVSANINKTNLKHISKDCVENLYDKKYCEKDIEEIASILKNMVNVYLALFVNLNM